MRISVEGQMALAVVSTGGDHAVDYLHAVVSGAPMPARHARGGELVIDCAWPVGDVRL